MQLTSRLLNQLIREALQVDDLNDRDFLRYIKYKPYTKYTIDDMRRVRDIYRSNDVIATQYIEDPRMLTNIKQALTDLFFEYWCEADDPLGRFAAPENYENPTGSDVDEWVENNIAGMPWSVESHLISEIPREALDRAEWDGSQWNNNICN